MVGQPEIGEVSKDWLIDFARIFFGSLDDQNNVRYIKDFFMLISKKNSKSTLAAAIMMTVLCINIRPEAEFLIIAPTKEAADNAFDPARAMVKVDPELSTIFMVQDHIRTITHRGTNAKLKVVAADRDTLGGTKAVGVLVEELWLFGKKESAIKMFTEATGGLASRQEGFVIYLTTQSDETPAGVFKQKLQYARKVRDGKIKDPQFLPVLYEFPPQMIKDKAYEDPQNWHITNPNMGASVDESFIRRKLAVSNDEGEDSLQQVQAKHLNLEIGLDLSADRWPGVDYWLSSTDKAVTLEMILETCEVVAIGIDGGGLDDLLGLTVAGREKEEIGKRWLTWSHAWAHKSVFKRRKEISTKLREFEKAGELTVVNTSGEDIQGVVDIVLKVEAAELLDSIGVDPIGIADILDALEDADIDPDIIKGVSQGFKLGGAIKTAERRLESCQMMHADQALMNWCVGNCKIEDRANSILVTKKASGKAKIDPVMALFNAVSLLSLNPAAKTSKFQMMIF